MTDTVDPATDPATIRWMGLCYIVSQRDGISMDEASDRLEDLMNSPEVLQQHADEQAALAQQEATVTAVQAAEPQLAGALGALQAILDALRPPRDP